MIRPQPAAWFEILVARDDVARLLEALGATGTTELEPRAATGLPPTLADLAPHLRAFAELALRYEGYWPASRLSAGVYHEPPAQTLARCLGNVRAWAQDAEPLIAELQANAVERTELVMWKRLTDACAASAIDLSLAAQTQLPLFARIVVFPEDSEPVMPATVLARRFVIDGVTHALVVGQETDLATIAQQVAGHKGAVHPLPRWMQNSAQETVSHISARLAEIDREDAEAKSKLEALHRGHDLACTLGDAERLDWVIANVRALESDDLFCFVTGWTSDLTGTRLERAVEESGARALLHYPPAPDAARSPLVLANPAWARPFEVFSHALGTPARSEADPTTLLAIVVPLMFGYMFGDVGQGIVIAVAGLALRRRFPIARLFIAGGISAAIFGLLFGSVFSLEGLIEPLWLDPLHEALTVLLVPLVGGAALLSVGLLLSGMEAYWRGEIGHWIAGDAWLALVYVSLVASIVVPYALYIAAVATVVFCIARSIDARRVTTVFAAIAELVERTLQILVNTLSFARVGAFALAHAGLSSAIVALMDAADTAIAKAAVLVVGNAVVLLLEGMVVSIQTTRLVLFEFFTRFLAAPGRTFRPLPPPPLLTQEPSR
jgi:V/A-type H+-transporting ATPase subunit I